MKVTVNVSLEPGYRPNTYALDITALWNDGNEDVAQRDILYAIVNAIEPGEDTDLRVWLTALLKTAAEQTEHDLVWVNEQGVAKLTLKDFKPLNT